MLQKINFLFTFLFTISGGGAPKRGAQSVRKGPNMPCYATVRHPAGLKQVVSLCDLALLPNKPDHTNENSVLSEPLPVESHFSYDTENTPSGSTIVEEAPTTITAPLQPGADPVITPTPQPEPDWV